MITDPQNTYKKKALLHNLQARPISIKRNIVYRLRNSSPVLMLSGATQLISGFIIVALSITGYVKPLWVASLMSVIGSISTMTGAYILYEVFSERNEIDNLYKTAIRRVISSKN